MITDQADALLCKWLIHSGFDGVMIFDCDCRYTLWNRAMERLFGVGAAEVLGRCAFELFPFLKKIGEDRHYLKALDGIESDSTNRPFEIPATGKSGIFEAHYGPLLDGAGGIIGGVGIVRDVTHQEQAADIFNTGRATELAAANVILQAEYRELYETAPVGYHEIDSNGIIVRVNQTEADLLGYRKEEMIGRSIVDFVVEREIAIKAIGEKFKSPHPLGGFERRYRCKDGRIIDVHIKDRQILDEQGQVVRIRSILEDITARKRAEEQQAELEREQAARHLAERANRAKDRFLAILSHELRTPLTPVLAISSAMETHRDLSPELLQDIRMIRRNVELEAKLIDDLLDLTRIANGKMHLSFDTVDAHAALHDALTICDENIEARHLQVTLELHATKHYVNGDFARLQQVFWNLIKNAVKFTPVNGKITLRTMNRCATENGPEQLVIEVIDTGIGIEPENLTKIFGAFEQGDESIARRFGGLGLGLAISKAMVDAHHGTLTACSQGKGQGAMFTVTLTTTENQKEIPAASISGTTQSHGERMKILMVEDHADTLRVMTRLLRNLGYEVTGAGSVAAALRAAENEQFDLLLSDLGLPDGSGHDLMRNVKARHGLKGIAFSGFGMEEDIQRSHEAGFSVHLTKPLNLPLLQKAIRETTENGKP